MVIRSAFCCFFELESLLSFSFFFRFEFWWNLALIYSLFDLKIGTERIGLDAAGDNLGDLGLNLEATGPGVFDALFSSFSMILVTEVRLPVNILS